METPIHAELKRAAVLFLLEHGCGAAATEVRCPLSRYRADAAGYLDTRPTAPVRSSGAGTLWSDPANGAPARLKTEPRTVVIECKQSRGDFLRDTARADQLLEARDRLTAERQRMEEELIRQYEPHLRRSGEFLFDELETWDFERSGLASYRRVLRELRRVDEQLYGQTKFFLMARYRVADRLYLMAPRGVIKKRELPVSWGMLEVAARRGPRSEESPAVQLAVEAHPLASRPEIRSRVLRNIAVAATREVVRQARRIAT